MRPPPHDAFPSVATFRARVDGIVRREARQGRRDVVILAIDGIGLSLARRLWRGADIRPMVSVMPTTSVSAWLSSLTGLPVSRHGVPGVAIRLPDFGMVNVLEHRGPLGVPAVGNIFTDAASHGYLPLAVVGDWQPYDCRWRDELLHGAGRVAGALFYAAGDASPGPESLRRKLQEAVEPLRAAAGEQPRLIWCFIDADRLIHREGYSPAIRAFLQAIDRVARRWAAAGAVVLAHSDHGLVPTRHSPAVHRTLEEAKGRFGCASGGAGRLRWIYVPAEQTGTAIRYLKQAMPASVAVLSADLLFEKGSLARERVGNVALLAKGTDFLTLEGYGYEHGSSQPEELFVPLARWSDC